MVVVIEQPRVIVDFALGPVLVIAPHMDDEVIGCGGAIALHVAAGARVTSVFMTDGAGAPGPQPTTRHDEARSVARFLRTEPPTFLDAPDTALNVEPQVVSGLAATIDTVGPAVLYVPFAGDAHRDHAVTSEIVSHAATEVSTDLSRTVVRSYEVWSPLPATVAVDISEVINRKLLALQHYRSQFVAHTPEPILGLNRYRAMGIGGGATYAECFIESPWPEYLAAIRST